MFDLLAVLDLVDENLCRLKARNEVLLNDKRSVSRNVSRYFTLALLIDETTKATDINVVAVRHGILHYIEKSFYRRGYVSFVHPGLLRDFVYYICFSHFVYF